jgi:hypothetical protein
LRTKLVFSKMQRRTWPIDKSWGSLPILPIKKIMEQNGKNPLSLSQTGHPYLDPSLSPLSNGLSSGGLARRRDEGSSGGPLRQGRVDELLRRPSPPEARRRAPPSAERWQAPPAVPRRRASPATGGSSPRVLPHLQRRPTPSLPGPSSGGSSNPLDSTTSQLRHGHPARRRGQISGQPASCGAVSPPVKLSLRWLCRKGRALIALLVVRSAGAKFTANFYGTSMPVRMP